MPSLSQYHIQAHAIPADKYLPEHLHAQGAELVTLRMRSTDAHEATRSAKAAVSMAKLEDAAVLRRAAADPDATPAALRKASTSHCEADALLALARTERSEKAVVDVQSAAERRWSAAMRRSAAARVEIVQSLCDESAVPLRKAAAAVIAARSDYMAHVTALNDALDDDHGRNPSTNVAPSSWRPSLKSTVRYAPGGISDTLDLSKLAPALKADCCRHIAPTPKPSDVARQAGDELAAMAGRK